METCAQVPPNAPPQKSPQQKANEKPYVTPSKNQRVIKPIPQFNVSKDIMSPARITADVAMARAPCALQDDKMRPAVPQSGFGLSISLRPTFWIYVPYKFPRELRFQLFDSNEKLFYKNSFSYSGIPGIIGIPYPIAQPPMKPGEIYEWKLTYPCENKPDDPYISAFVQPFIPDAMLTSQIRNSVSLRDELLVYAEKGIWYDALNIFAELLHQNSGKQPLPKDWEMILQKDWEDFLNSPGVSLGNLSSKPFSPCCFLR
jgi:Domain of Unknown Function (DUF928)